MYTTTLTKQIPEQKLRLENLIAQKIVTRSLRDLVSKNQKFVEKSETYVKTETFENDVGLSHFPDEIVTVVREAVELSPVQKKHVIKEVLEWIKNPLD
tara:strand:+ start:120 stop:413 length:294 start_codon:yes stop_codon:yes gene_type:complete